MVALLDAPYVAGTEMSTGAGVTDIDVLLPSTTPGTDDLVVVAIATSDVALTLPGSGTWSIRKQYQDAGLSRLTVYTTLGSQITPGATYTWTAAGSGPYVAWAGWVTSQAITFSAGHDGAGTSITGDTVTAPYEGRNNLFFAFAGWVDDDEAITDYPTYYTHVQEYDVSGGGTNAGAGLAVAARRYPADAATFDEFTLASTEGWATFSMVVQPETVAPASPPSGTAGLEASMQFDGSWTDVGEDSIYTRRPVRIRHGRTSWTDRADPADLQFTLDNRAGLWSPGYETGAYFGRFRRGTPVRIGAPQPDSYLEHVEGLIDEDIAVTAYAADDASFDVGDIDLRWEIEPTRDFVATGGATKIAHRTGAWRLYMYRTDTQGPVIWFQWNDSAGTHDYRSNDGDGLLPADADHRRLAYRVTLDVSSGQGRFYWSESIDGTWTEIGDGSTSAGATNIEAVNDHVYVASYLPGAYPTWQILRGMVYAFQMHDGIAGTPVIDADFTGQTPGATSFTDDASASWVIGGQGRISATRWRGHGEVSDLPSRWELSGNDQWAPASATGYLRRLRQGQKPLQSTLRRGYDRETIASTVAAYWPCEEERNPDLMALGPVIGRHALNRADRWSEEPAHPGECDVFACSNPIPTFHSDLWRGNIDFGSHTGEWMLRFLFYVPSEGFDTGPITIIRVFDGYLYWSVKYDGTEPGGDLQVRAYDTDFTYPYAVDQLIDFNVNGKPLRLSLEIEQNGADIDWALNGDDANSGFSGGYSDTLTGHTVGRPQKINIGQDNGLGGEHLSGAAVGHITVEREIRPSSELVDELTAYRGERAITRVRRLCTDEGLEARCMGNPALSAVMGPQYPKTVADLLQECADTDLGILYDPPECLAVGFRSGSTMYNQEPGFEIDYDAGQAAGTPELDRSTRNFANDVTVTNAEGTIGRAVLTDGDLSIDPHPDGVGRHERSYAVNDGSPAERITSHAWARLALHSPVDPDVSRLRLATHLAGISDADRQAIAELRIGDKVTISDLPALVHPDDIGQIVQGWTEIIDTHTRTLDLASTSSAPWDNGVIEPSGDETVARYDTSGSTLATGELAGATSLLVITDEGPLWTTDGADLPFDVSVAGARVTVTAISGASSPQTFTVTATTVDLPGGADIALADPTVWSL